MFDDYAKKLHKLGQDVPKIFDKETIKGSLFFISEAVKKTNKEKLVDTGNYKRNWQAKHENKDTEHKIIMFNNVEYASFIENGYTIKKDHFVPFSKMQGTPKSTKLIASFRAKYPKAKGFIARARHYKGKFIGHLSVKATRKYIIDDLRKLLGREYK